MEQLQQGLSDSTPKAGSDRILKIGESLISALQLIYMSQISPKSNDRVISTLFKVQEEDFNQ